MIHEPTPHSQTRGHLPFQILLLSLLMLGLPTAALACGMSAFGPGLYLTFTKDLDQESALVLAGVGLVCQSLFLGMLVFGRWLAALAQKGLAYRLAALALFFPNSLIWLVFAGSYLLVIVPTVLMETLAGKVLWNNIPLVLLLPMIWFHTQTLRGSF